MDENDMLGRQVGHFRIIDLLGVGGMGSVYLAFDERLQRRVALKALQQGQLDEESKARFQREARVLTQLKHPHICQIYDLLVEPDQDYLVLELVDGRNLNEVIASRPDHATKLRIARQLADVLVVTHAKGIIHRDLKPANVMMTAEGDVKVLDFGLARGAAVRGEFVTMAHTVRTSEDADGGADGARQLGPIVGTLAYMSPEQALGETVTTASDMFAYGLLLQELFTGRSAYLPGLPAGAQLARAQAGATAPLTGLTADLAALINRLKDTAATVRPTAFDTVEWLQRIEAAPQMKRRRMLAWSAAALLALVAVGMSYQTYRINRQSQRIAQEADRANREAQSAKEVSEFLVKVFEVSDPGQSRGETVTARELLDKAAQDIQGRLMDQPVVKARMELTLALVYQSLGLYTPALSLSESSLDLRRKNLPATDAAVAEGERRLGFLRFLRGEMDQAAPLLKSAAEIQERILGPDSPALAATFNDLAVVYQNQGKTVIAESLYVRALKIYDKALPGSDADVAEVLGDLAYLYNKQGRYAQAETLYLRATTAFEKALGPNDPRLAIALSQLGGVYRDQGKPASAEPLTLRAISIQEKVLGPSHPYLALRLDGLGKLYTDEGRYAEAEKPLLAAVAIHEKTAVPNQLWLAQSLGNLAIVYRDEGKIAQAEPIALRAVAILEKARGLESIDTAAGMVLLAELYILKGKPDQGRPLLARALAIFDKATSLDTYPRSLQAKALDLAGRSDEARVKAEALSAQGYGRGDFLRLCKKLGVPAT